MIRSLTADPHIKRQPVIDILQATDYEIRSSWWAQWLSWHWAQNLAGSYFAWKVKRKHGRYYRSKSEEYRVALRKLTAAGAVLLLLGGCCEKVSVCGIVQDKWHVGPLYYVAIELEAGGHETVNVYPEQYGFVEVGSSFCHNRCPN
jgi:hypothetical protein